MKDLSTKKLDTVLLHEHLDILELEKTRERLEKAQSEKLPFKNHIRRIKNLSEKLDVLREEIRQRLQATSATDFKRYVMNSCKLNEYKEAVLARWNDSFKRAA